MGIPTDPSAAYVDLVSNAKYASRTSDTAEFDALKDLYLIYLNTNANSFPAKKQVQGLALLVCHHYALDSTKPPDIGIAGGDLTRGAVTSESVGEVSIGYGGMAAAGSIDGWKAWLSQTVYGSEFIYLMKTFRPSPLVL